MFQGLILPNSLKKVRIISMTPRSVCLTFQAPRKTLKSPDPTRVARLAKSENRGSVDKEKVITAPQKNPSRNQSQKNLGPLSPGKQLQPHLPLAAFYMTQPLH